LRCGFGVVGGDFVDWISSQIIAPPAIPPDEAERTEMQDISVMEDHDTLANFEP